MRLRIFPIYIGSAGAANSAKNLASVKRKGFDRLEHLEALL